MIFGKRNGVDPRNRAGHVDCLRSQSSGGRDFWGRVTGNTSSLLCSPRALYSLLTVSPAGVTRQSDLRGSHKSASKCRRVYPGPYAHIGFERWGSLERRTGHRDPAVQVGLKQVVKKKADGRHPIFRGVVNVDIIIDTARRVQDFAA